MLTLSSRIKGNKMTLTLMPMLKGFDIGAGLIIPIGAQNSYILNQSIKRNYHLLAASVCVICDFFLMTIGVYGGGALINSNSVLAAFITWGGIVFLTVYGTLFFRQFWLANSSQVQKEMSPSTRKVVLFTTLAVTLLNPHAYLDTVVIIGSISGEFAEHEKFAFLIGTLIASIVWFYTLSLGAAKMSPWLGQLKVQRLINLFVALIMWGIAIMLLRSVL